MARWKEARPAAPYAEFWAWSSAMAYVTYVPDQFPLQEETYWNADLNADGKDLAIGWSAELSLDTYPPPRRFEGFEEIPAASRPNQWSDVRTVGAGGMVLEQARTPDCLPWTQTLRQGVGVVVGLEQPIRRRSRIRVEVWQTANDWQSPPTLLIGAVGVWAPAQSWDVLLAPVCLRLESPDHGTVAVRYPPVDVLVAHALPTSDPGTTMIAEGRVLADTTALMVAIVPGELPHYVIPNCMGPAPDTPMALASVAIRNVWFAPTEEEPPREHTRTWTARQVLARNSLR